MKYLLIFTALLLLGAGCELVGHNTTKEDCFAKGASFFNDDYTKRVVCVFPPPSK